MVLIMEPYEKSNLENQYGDNMRLDWGEYMRWLSPLGDYEAKTNGWRGGFRFPPTTVKVRKEVHLRDPQGKN